MTAFTQPSRPYNHGFSLVEVMVAMVIGLLGIIVIMQVFSVFEGQKRSTTGGNDAQNEGVIALYGMDRDISQSGYGINSPKLNGCPLITPMISLPSLAPVIINPQKGALAAVINAGNPLVNAIPADANTDTLLIIYGNSNSVAEGILIENVDIANKKYSVKGGATLAAASAVGAGGRGFQKDDFVIADSGARSVSAPTCPTLNLTQVIANDPDFVPVQQTPTFVYNDISAKTDLPTLYNLGPRPHILAYAVKNGVLSVCDYAGETPQNCADNTATWTQLATGIVSMKAQCVSPAGVRLALVSRNSKIEPNVVTGAANLTWSGASPIVAATGTLGPNAAADEPWMHYRYKVFETFIPIRNAIWVGAKGC